jgi:phenylacetate-coenzyme A ligase PaaK-like adenylate-forming protein
LKPQYRGIFSDRLIPESRQGVRRRRRICGDTSAHFHTLQTQRLKWTLKHAYENVPMYRRKFDAAGVHPDDFRELNDLKKFRI